MSKDLERKGPVPKQDVPKRSEVSEIDAAQHALVEGMLFGTEVRPVAGRPRVILALDCTTSMGEFIEERRITPEAASTMANALFAGRTGLLVRLAFFRGDDQWPHQPRQLRFSNKWHDTPGELARALAAIEHWPGWTQHCRLLRHAVAQAQKQAIQELVIVSDAFEEQTPLRPHGDDLTAARVHARRLRDLGVKIVVGYKGTIRGSCPLDRAGLRAEEAFKIIAEENDGRCFLLDPATLAERFGEIAAHAALTATGDVVGAQALLELHRAIPFELNVVGEQVSNVKCKL